MLVFTLMVVDSLYGSAPGIISAVVALVISRQAFTRLARLTRDIVKLHGGRNRLDAVFRHKSVLFMHPSSSETDLWSLLMPERRAQWVGQLVGEVSASAVTAPATTVWWGFDGKRVAALRCEWNEAPPMLVKVFERPALVQALHEADLLQATPPGLPAPVWRGAAQLEGSRVHILEIDADTTAPCAGAARYAPAVRKRLLMVEPPSTLADRYVRSRPMLWDRISSSALTRLRAVATSQRSMDQIAALIDALPYIKPILKDLPLVIVNPDISGQNISLNEKSEPELLHWGRWTLEPIGSGWNAVDRESLTRAYHDASRVRASIHGIAVEQLHLASALFELDRLLYNQRFEDALEIMPNVTHMLGSLPAPAAAHGGPRSARHPG
jgi:hypothetical protein